MPPATSTVHHRFRVSVRQVGENLACVLLLGTLSPCTHTLLTAPAAAADKKHGLPTCKPEARRCA